MSVPPRARGRLDMQPCSLNIYAPQSCTDNARTCCIQRADAPTWARHLMVILSRSGPTRS
jgi:hypothetical protein